MKLPDEDSGPPARLFALLGRLERLGIRLGLDPLRALLGRLGDPHRATAVVLVAGTNGKGSTAAFLASMAGAGGYRTGLYTSPHLEEVTERIRVGGRAVSNERLYAVLRRVVGAAWEAGDPLPTYFEALTAAAFVVFAEDKVDLAVLEVGMGGRLDATNLADPLLAIVAPIALDHQEHLGAGLAAIAREKAGILRRGRPAVAWVEEGAALAALQEVALEKGALLRDATKEANLAAGELDEAGGRALDLDTGRARYRLRCPLAGRHQLRNLALAVLGAEILAAEGWSLLTAEAMVRGAERCRWPGRAERVELPAGRGVLLDCAHNPAGAASLAGLLEETGQPFHLLFGALADKDVGAMLGPLARRAQSVVLTAPDSPRAADPRDLARLARVGTPHVERDRERALDVALERAGGESLVVCGSIYLVGAIRRALRRRFGRPASSAEALW